MKNKHTYTGFKDWHEGDLIKDQYIPVVYEIVWSDDYMGWWCISLDKTMEQPLNEMANHCNKISNKFEISDDVDN